MKKYAWLLVIGLLLGVFLLSCNKDKTENLEIGQLISHSDCKDFNTKSSSLTESYGPDKSCVTYSYNPQNKKLTFKHINSAFNCCPGILFCQIEVLNDTIRIIENEENADCRCNCLYDLDINVLNIELDKYQVIIDEPYCLDQEKINFEIDLAVNDTGEFLVTRTIYPWGIQ